MSVKKWFQEILHPANIQFRDMSLEDVRSALKNPTVLDAWIERIVGKLQDINRGIDLILDKPDRERIWEALAVERRTLKRALEMVIEVRDELESERQAKEDDEKFKEKYKSVAQQFLRSE